MAGLALNSTERNQLVRWARRAKSAQAWALRAKIAHVISYDDLHARSLLALAARGRFQVSRVNDAALARYGTRSPQQLLALLADHLQPGGLPAALGGRVGLAETLIHHQDIRRALGQPRPIPAERLLPALRLALIAPDIAGPWRIRGIRVVATDLRFSAGVRPEVRGTAEVLLMAIAGPMRRGQRTIGHRPAKTCRPHRRLTTPVPHPARQAAATGHQRLGKERRRRIRNKPAGRQRRINE